MDGWKLDKEKVMEILLDHSFCAVLLPKMPLMTLDLYKQSNLCSPLRVLDNMANRISELENKHHLLQQTIPLKTQ